MKRAAWLEGAVLGRSSWTAAVTLLAMGLGATGCGSSSNGGSSGAPKACTKGQVTASEVVMLGDSYMDYGGVGPALLSDAQASYRHYYLAGSALNYGSGQLNIPYQFDTMALGDTSIPNPTDIKVIIMDGGGNDVLIDNRNCLTAPPPDPTCQQAIDASLARGNALFQEFAAKGVQQVVYFFYPHLDPNGGGILPTPAPGVNVALDYALSNLEKTCCGAPFQSTSDSYSCRGTSSGIDCIVVDTNPGFVGHLSDYLMSDHVHPNSSGAKVIADMVWKVMQQDCVAQ